MDQSGSNAELESITKTLANYMKKDRHNNIGIIKSMDGELRSRDLFIEKGGSRKCLS